VAFTPNQDGIKNREKVYIFWMHNKMTETFCNIEKKTYVLQKVAQQRIKVCPENKA